ncbi:MAG: hypothetical protein ACTSW1_09180 [Candidatus Hodarchaeales archaeon]
MPKRRYKSKWHRYGSVLAVILIALGGLFMILLGAITLLNQSPPELYFLSNYIFLNSELQFLFNIVTVLAGIGILIIMTKQRPHDNKTPKWVLISTILAIIGGTLGGLIAFGGGLIYIILLFI